MATERSPDVDRPPVTQTGMRSTFKRDRAVTAVLLLLLIVYVFSFWGQAARLLPPPFDTWHNIYFRLLSDRWYDLTAGWVSSSDAAAVFWAIEAYLLGFLLPIAVLRATDRHPADVGLRRPKKGTTWLGLALASPALLIGIYLSIATEDPWASVLYETLELAAMLPEHFMVFGMLVAVMLPGRRFAREHAFSESASHRQFKTEWKNHLSLNAPEITAICVSGIVFQLIHLGVPSLEVLLALPAGLLFAYATICTRSIWPALIVHWALNLIPMTWMGIQNRLF